MASIAIDGVDYDLDTLDNDTKVLLNSLKFADGEMELLKARLALVTTARNTYAAELRIKLDSKK